MSEEKALYQVLDHPRLGTHFCTALWSMRAGGTQCEDSCCQHGTNCTEGYLLLLLYGFYTCFGWWPHDSVVWSGLYSFTNLNQHILLCSWPLHMVNKYCISLPTLLVIRYENIPWFVYPRVNREENYLMRSSPRGFWKNNLAATFPNKCTLAPTSCTV